MSFRKRNVVLGSSGSPASAKSRIQEDRAPVPGSRPSPLDGRLTTSTGTQSLDDLLAGHAGLPMGTSLLIQESGTTDFGGVLLRYYAAEGLVQGHDVHLFGYGDAWRRELPGIGATGGPKTSKVSDDKMKIAWRYETLGQRNVPSREPIQPISSVDGATPFCHPFDLSKRLESSAIKGQLFPYPVEAPLTFSSSQQSPLKKFITDIASRINNSPLSTIHRIIVPGLLSPTLYPSSASQPKEVLQFFHSLRALLRQYPTRVVALVTVPMSLFPRSSGLTRWMELLSDGVIELVSLPRQAPMTPEPGNEDKGQGLLRSHILPVFHEKGGGLDGTWATENLSFRLSSSSGMIITPFSLPPIEDDMKQVDIPGDEKAKKQNLEF